MRIEPKRAHRPGARLPSEAFFFPERKKMGDRGGRTSVGGPSVDRPPARAMLFLLLKLILRQFRGLVTSHAKMRRRCCLTVLLFAFACFLPTSSGTRYILRFH